MAKTSTKKTSTKKKTTKKKTAKTKTLLIVESPAKARTINKYLGSKYIVEASVGHIKDLVKVRLGVKVDEGFAPEYTTIKGKADIMKKLRTFAKESKNVLIATDPDREGEAIAWHIANEVKKHNDDVKRVLFNEITKNGIKKAITEPLEVNNELFLSQQARRVMDRLIGYQVSPFLSRAMLEKTTKVLSAGRVQSVALRMICEREEEIRAFVPIEYWSINGKFSDDKESVQAKLVAFENKSIKNPEGSLVSEENKTELAKRHFIRDEKQAEDLIAKMKQEDFSVSKISKREVKRRAQSPFTTSLLQQEASRRLGFPNKKTMMIAQKLYEGVTVGDLGHMGLITYMRTDSVRISPEAEAAAADFISNKYGPNYLPKSKNVYKSKSSNTQDAHEAIRPTSMEVDPAKARAYLSNDEARLYELIFNRFIASQMAAAVLDQTNIEFKGGDFLFRATGSVIKFPGFLAVYADMSENSEKDNAILNIGHLKEGDPVNLEKTLKKQSFTKPKPRFTEASLVKELDELGIGRPSTYASIVSTIVDREYVELISKAFHPTELGEDVNKVLVKNFPSLFNVAFTASMEEELDQIAVGELTYVDMLNSFYDPFKESLDYAEKHGDIPEILCEECGAPMLIKVSRTGRFLGCSKYPDCRFTKPLPRPQKEEKGEPEIAEGEMCHECGKQMLYRQGRFGRFLGCEDYPNCKGIRPITSGVKCPKCSDGDLIERFSPKSRKKFYGCSAYPDCDHITNYEPIDKPCPSCGHYYIEIRFKKTADGYQKYLNCPSCKEKFEMKQ